MTYEPVKYDMREATVEEIATYARIYSIGNKVSFRHFTVETSRRNAKNGVAHKQYSKSGLRVIDGKAYVHHHGALDEVTAQFGTINGGTARLWDLRIKSDYLPTPFK